MWNLSGAGIESVSHALAGGFLTTGLPGSPGLCWPLPMKEISSSLLVAGGGSFGSPLALCWYHRRRGGVASLSQGSGEGPDSSLGLFNPPPLWGEWRCLVTSVGGGNLSSLLSLLWQYLLRGFGTTSVQPGAGGSPNFLLTACRQVGYSFSVLFGWSRTVIV